MGQYKLIALDIDGTLLNHSLKLSDENRRAVEAAQDLGVQVVVSTGRCLSEVRETLAELPRVRYLVCESGSCVYDVLYDRTLYVDPVPTEEIRNILACMANERVVIQAFHENMSYLNRGDDSWLQSYRMTNYRDVFKKCSVLDARLFDHFDERPFRIEKINLYFDNAKTQNHWAEVFARRPLLVCKSLAYMIEIISDRADKSVGLAKLCEQLGFGMDEVIAVGDSSNDIGMLRAAGLGVAMGNASAEVKSAADTVTDDCDHSGVAKVIRDYLLV